MTNMEWYTRRGYRLIKTVVNFYEEASDAENLDVRTVFMKRDLNGDVGESHVMV